MDRDIQVLEEMGVKLKYAVYVGLRLYGCVWVEGIGHTYPHEKKRPVSHTHTLYTATPTATPTTSRGPGS